MTQEEKLAKAKALKEEFENMLAGFAGYLLDQVPMEELVSRTELAIKNYKTTGNTKDLFEVVTVLNAKLQKESE